MINYNALNIPVDYDSPLIINYVERMATDIAKFTDDGVMKAVVKAGFDIDKDKLVHVMEQDKERYSEAYRKGYESGYQKMEEEIIRCKDCKYCNKYDFVCEHPNEWGNEDTRNQCNVEFFCADAERKEENE